MSTTENTYIEKFKVRSYEVDVRGRATALTISNFLQEIAGNHAGKLGVSVDKLLAKNLTWVLSRLHLQMNTYPLWREEVSILTWPSNAHGRFATRDFEIYNSKNNTIGLATTSWMLIDLSKMKPITMPDFIMEIERPNRDRAINDTFEKLPKLLESEYHKKFNVRLSDLDINQHVNNVNYIEWAIETVPLEVSKKYYLKQLEISFRAESKFGDSVSSHAKEFEESDLKTYLHSLTNKNTEQELALARTRWIKK